MVISEEKVKEFQSLYKKYFSRNLNENEAKNIAIKLLHLIKLVYKPMTKEEFDQIKNRIKELSENSELHFEKK